MTSSKFSGKYYYIKTKPWTSENPLPMNLWFLRILGWWEDTNWSQYLRSLYMSYAVFTTSIHIIMVASVFINMIVEWEHLVVVMDAANIFLVGIANSAKIYPFMFSRKKVLRCLRRLERMEAAGKSSAQRQELEEGARRFTRRVAWTLICSCMTSCLFWITAPLTIFRFTGAEEDVVATNFSSVGDAPASVHKPLPLQGWFPFDINSAPGWELAYVILAMATFINCWIACQTNGIFFAVMYFSYSGFRVLCAQLREIREDAEFFLKGNNKSGTDESLDRRPTKHTHAPQVMSNSLQMEMDVRLRSALHHHQLTLSFADAVKDLIGPVMFTECLAMSIMLCACTFQATQADTTGMKLAALIGFLLCELLELLCFCWAGTLVMVQSEMVSQAAFDCGWEDSSASFKTCLRFMMMRAQKPTHFTTLGFSTLSLQLFAALLRASYSYYAVLRQTDSEPANV